MFRLEAGGVRFLHTGDNRAEWPDAVSYAVGDVDVLLVTVDDSIHLLTYDEVDSLVRLLQPRVVIPMHYAIPGLHAAECELLPPKQWLDRQRQFAVSKTTVSSSPPGNCLAKPKCGCFSRPAIP